MTSLRRLLLVRHGETDWNAIGRLQGQLDIGLNSRGRQQAHALGARLAHENIDALHSSDLARADSTTQIVGQMLNLPCHLSAAWREMGLGELEGRDARSCLQLHGGDLVAAASSKTEPLAPGAEPFLLVRQRVLLAFRLLCERHAGQHVCLVTHGGVGKVLMAHLMGLPPEMIGRLSLRGNCGLSVVEFWNDCPKVVLLNDTSHLRGL